MRVNIENCLKNSLTCEKNEKSYYNFSISELINHLKELRDRTKRGDMTVLDEFFNIYVFDDNQ